MHWSGLNWRRLGLFAIALLLAGCGKSESGTQEPPAEPMGFDSIESAYETLAQAVTARDAQTFRRLLAKDPAEVKKFDAGVKELMIGAGSKEMAQSQLIESFEYFSFRHTLEKQGKRYPPVVDGDRAFIIAAYVDKLRNEPKHDVVTFRKIDGKWYYHGLEGADMTWFRTEIGQNTTQKFPPAEAP